DHDTCARLLAESDERLIVPSPVLAELDWLAGKRLGPGPFGELLADIEEGTVSVVDLDGADYVRVRELLATYADSDVGFVDAAVLAVVERLRENRLATLDVKHFRLLRPRHVGALELVPA
ncbi:MAG TPA: PIN domain-containing protein, partial [Gaiellaceae bacterium]|nr:PIN domain-containing protein [Gaiellaceae bacterium]